MLKTEETPNIFTMSNNSNIIRNILNLIQIFFEGKIIQIILWTGEQGSEKRCDVCQAEGELKTELVKLY